jgi:hypothetical protein
LSPRALLLLNTPDRLAAAVCSLQQDSGPRSAAVRDFPPLARRPQQQKKHLQPNDSQEPVRATLSKGSQYRHFLPSPLQPTTPIGIVRRNKYKSRVPHTWERQKSWTYTPTRTGEGYRSRRYVPLEGARRRRSVSRWVSIPLASESESSFPLFPLQTPFISCVLVPLLRQRIPASVPLLPRNQIKLSLMAR